MKRNEIINLAVKSGLPSKEAAEQNLWWLEKFAKELIFDEKRYYMTALLTIRNLGPQVEYMLDPNGMGSIDLLELPISRSALKMAGILYIGDLIGLSEEGLLSIPNVGRKSLNEIKEALAHRGLSLARN